MKKRMMSLLLAVFMIVGMLPMTVLAEEAAADVYEIATAADLIAFSASVNNGATTLDAVLTADIDLTGNDWVRHTYTNRSIGTLENPYAGTFDGNGHTISNMTIEVDNGNAIDGVKLATTEYVTGLFGVTDGAVIKDVTVSGTSSIRGNQELNARHGGVVAKAIDTTITGCVSYVEHSGYANLYYSDLFIYNVGGIVGYAEGITMDKCVNMGTICVYNSFYVGGLIGHIAASATPSVVTNSQNAASVLGTTRVGGLIGFVDGCSGEEADLIENCYNTGDVGSEFWNKVSSPNVYQGRNQGGTLFGGHNANATVDYVNCYTVGGTYDDGTVNNNAETEPNTVEAIYRYGVGDTYNQFNNVHYLNANVNTLYASEAGITGHNTAEEMQTKAFAETLGEGFAYVSGGYPVLAWQCEHAETENTYVAGTDGTHSVTSACAGCGISVGEGYEEACTDDDGDFFCDACGAYVESDAVYEIADEEDLLAFAALVNSGAATVNAKLTADITLTGAWISNWTSNAIGTLAAPYGGVFDGQGYTVSGLNMTIATATKNAESVELSAVEHVAGLFGATDGATIKDVTVAGTLNVSGRQTQLGRYGGLIGKATDTVVTDCFGDVTVTGEGWLYYEPYLLYNFGGLVGYAEGMTMDRCGFDGSIETYNTGYVGGLVGHIGAYAEPTTITNSYNNAGVVAGMYGGGIAGYIDGCTGEGKADLIKNCYSTGDVGSVTFTGSGTNKVYDARQQGGTLVGAYVSAASFELVNCYTTGSTHAIDTALGEAEGIHGLVSTRGSNNKPFTNLHYLNIGVHSASPTGSGITAYTDAFQMQTKAFAETLGDGFAYVPNAYPVLVWQCEHGTESSVCTPNGNGTHTVEPVCDGCGASVGESYEEACSAENGIYCDKCGGVVEGAVYEIATADDLKAFRDLVNSGVTDLDAVLTADIDLAMGSDPATTKANWTPIGTPDYVNPTGATAYTGIFDGQGHTISGISYYFSNVNSTLGDTLEDASRAFQVGLFGHVEGATIRNLTVEGAGYTLGRLSNYSKLGGIAAYAVNTTVTNCVSNVTWGGSCAASYGYHVNLGGIVGYADGVTMDKCANYGEINAQTFQRAGGLIGYVVASAAPTTVTNSFNAANIVANDLVGGLVGKLEGCATAGEKNTFENCYNLGKIGCIQRVYKDGAWVASPKSSGGGLAGQIAKTDAAASDCIAFVNCYSVATTADDVLAAGHKINGICPSMSSGVCKLENCYYLYDSELLNAFSGSAVQMADADMQTIAFAETLGEGYVLANDAAYPVLDWQCKHNMAEAVISNGNLTHDVVIKCENCSKTESISADNEACTDENGDDLCDLCGGSTVAETREIATEAELIAFAEAVNGGYSKLSAVLTEDIALTSAWIKNLKTNAIGTAAAPWQGTFDGQGHTITGLDISFNNNNANLGDTASDIERDFRLGLFGTVENAEIKNVTVEGAIALSGRQSNVCAIGGIAARAENTTFEKVISRVAISGYGNYNWGTYKSVGGIVGYANDVSLSKCGNEAELHVMGNQMGGLIGSANGNISVIDCYNTADVAGTMQVGGLIGPVVLEDSDTLTVRNSYSSGDFNVFRRGDTTNGETSGEYFDYIWHAGLIYSIDGTGTAVIENCYVSGDTQAPAMDNDATVSAVVSSYTSTVSCTFNNNYYVNREQNESVATAVEAQEIATAEFAKTMGDGYVLMNGGEHPVNEWTCEHDMTAEACVSNGDKTHAVYGKCADCTKLGEVATEAVDCTDEDADGSCDLCGGIVDCVHNDTSLSYIDNGNGTHDVVETCVCGEELSTTTENCADDDADGYCDLCEGVMPEDTCDHAETTSETVYNGNKTHTTTVTCVCGEVIETVTADCVDEDKDCACDTCEGVIKTVTLTTVAGSNMNLGNELQVNFIINDPTVEGDYVAYIHQDTDDEGGVTYEIPSSDWEFFSAGRSKVGVRVRAMEMTDTLTLTIKDAEGYDVIDAYETSVRAYAAKALVAASSSAQMKTLVVDMVNYGAAAQTNFSYKATDLANNQLTDAQKALATGDITCANNQIKGTNNLGANLALDDCILLNVFFSG
ncbi:MAG: hypothetical protein J6J43_03270, partial [Oscillospiraceae bacterium]|nr:hypothetical protein [Oscillospiraceae bacterium]